MKSMTGYGKAVCALPDKKITIEIKSVNSKQLDINLKLPSLYRDKDGEIRAMASKMLERGKVEIYVAMETIGLSNTFSLNTTLAKKYYEDLKQLSAELGTPMTEDFLQVLIRMPDIIKTQSEEPDEEEWQQIAVAVENALLATNEFRENEGQVLRRDMLQLSLIHI
jgi:uncharacterized protein (TIGR00255 family)